MKTNIKVTCVLCLFAAGVWAQSFLGSITGTVLDQTGAVVPKAKVVVTETRTGVEHETATNTSGGYLFGDLVPGTYTITITAPGFKETRSGQIVLTANQVQRFDGHLEVGSSTETIEVAAAAPTINTENAEVTGLVGRQELLNIPVNQRSTFSYMFLNSYNVQGVGSSYSIGGLRGNNTNFTIDGVTSNSSIFGGQVGPQTEESFESIREMKLMASNNSAEFTNVSTVLIESRSGANQPHGTAFFLTQNNWLNARSFFNPGPNTPGPIRHQFGASFGGPVWIPKVYNGHNKTFFYFTWEQERFPGGYNGTGNVPTNAFRTGDFSSLLSQGIVIKDPATGLPFQGNVIPPGRVSPVAINLQDFGFLAPNYGPANSYTGNWTGFFPTSDFDNRYVTRIDHQISEHDSLAGRASIRAEPEPAQYDADLPIFYHNQYRRTINAYISETHLFSPTVINEFRIGFSRDHSTLSGHDNGGQVVQQLGLQGINTNPNLTGVPSVQFSNFSNMYEFYTYFWTSETEELLDNVTLVKGRHNIKAGVLVRYNRPNQTNQPNNAQGGLFSTDFGYFRFTGFATGFDYADFLLGIPQESQLTYRAPNAYMRYANSGLFIQDDFHVTPKLTVNLGLRWEYFQPPVDINDLRFSFDPKTGALVVPTQKSLDIFKSPFFPSNIPIETATQAGFPSRSLLESHWKNFAPRFSFAYRPLASDTFVVRGGYGIFFSPLIGTPLLAFEGGPFASTVTYNNAITNGTSLFSFPHPFPASGGTLPSQAISPVAENLKTPYVQQWNLTVEHELPSQIVARVAYRGFMSDQIPYTRDLNMPPASADPANANLFTYPNYFQVNLTEDAGIQKLNAFDVGIERKLSAGFTFQSQYTLAKNLSDTGDDGEANGIMDPYNRALDMGNTMFAPRNRWITTALYELPFGRGKPYASNLGRVANQVVGGWQISGVYAWQTGQFLTPTVGGIDPTNNRSNLTGLNRPDCTGNPNLSSPSITNWFNESVFSTPAAGLWGNCGRGTIVGPGISNFDLGLMKNFRFAEKATFQLRATATNAFNHPLWRNPSAEVISSTNGNQITNVLGTTTNRASIGAGYRIIEVGARIDF